MKTGVIIQARVSSTRLPGKILLELPYGSGITVLQQVIRRVKKAKNIDQIIVATTNKKVDDIIIEIAQKEKVDFFRGSEKNVLKRYYQAAKKFKLDTIVRVTSDEPFLDANLINQVVKKLIDNSSDFCSNSLNKPYNHGMNVEVFTFEALKKAYYGATKNYEYEHVCPYFYISHSCDFKISEVSARKSVCTHPVRITLDTWNDYIFLCTISDFLYKKNHFFSLSDIMKLIKVKPWIKEINSTTKQKRISIMK